jgi:hypothetical protein
MSRSTKYLRRPSRYGQTVLRTKLCSATHGAGLLWPGERSCRAESSIRDSCYNLFVEGASSPGSPRS